MSIDQGERALATFSFIEDERGGETKFERIALDEKIFFLREALDNKGGEITRDMAWSLADEVADELRDKGQSLSTHFYNYDRKEGVWSVYSFSVDAKNPNEFEFEHLGYAPQCLLEKKFQYSLARSDEEVITQTQQDIAYMKKDLKGKLIEIGFDRVFGNKETREQAAQAYDAHKEKTTLLKEAEAFLKQYIPLEKKAVATAGKASTIEGQMRETIEGRFRGDKEEERTRNRGR